jgi:O-antigen ligase
MIMMLFLPSQKLRIGMLGGMIGVAGLVLLASTIGNTPIFSRFFNSDVSTLNGRTYLWAAVIDHFDPTQLLGNGMQASQVLLINLQVGVGRGVIATATHNIFLETLYDYGIIGLTLLVLMFTSIPAKLLTKIRTATPDHHMLLGMAVAIFFNVIVQSFESNDFWNPSIGIYFWIIMSLPFALCWITLKRPSATDEESNEKESISALEAIQPQERPLARV